MDRNDLSIKEILDQISKDDAKAVVEEVRNIVLRDLKVNTSMNEQPAAVKSQQQGDVPHTDSAISKSAVALRDQSALKETATEEELAFTIDKESETYKNIFSMVQWYRDSFFVGPEFADRRSSEKQRQNINPLGYNENKFAEISNKMFNHNISYKSLFGRGYMNPKPSEFTGLGHPYLTDYASWYITSNYAVDLLRPTTMWLASKDGPMLQPATQSLASTIPLFQETADDAAISNMLWLLKDQEWKDWAKSLTTQEINTQFMDRSQKDG